MTTAHLELRISAKATRDEEVWISARPKCHLSAILGNLKPVRVQVNAGTSELLPLPICLSDVELGTAPVGRYLVEWEWFVSDTADGAGQIFARTRLRVYVTLGVPTSPWTQDDVPGDDDYPWIQAIDWSCRWAGDQTNERGIVTAITRSLDAIGGTMVTVHGVPTRFVYSPSPEFLTPGHRLFLLMRFLSILSGSTTLARARANCADLAAAVAIFANLLGCSIRIRNFSHKDGANFPVNPVRVFGLDEKNSEPHRREGFEYHRTAELIRSGRSSIYDACVQLDSHGSPRLRPFCWAPATGMPVRATTGQSYLERLVAGSAKAIAGTAAPLPTVKRTLEAVPSAILIARFEAYRARIDAALSGATQQLHEAGAIAAPGFHDHVDWETTRHGVLTARRFVLRPPDRPEHMTILHVIDCGNETSSRDVAAEILASASCPFGIVPGWRGALLFAESSRTEAVAIAAGHVVFARSAGIRPVNTVRVVSTFLDR